jgi:hypothetical protein
MAGLYIESTEKLLSLLLRRVNERLGKIIFFRRKTTNFGNETTVFISKDNFFQKLTTIFRTPTLFPKGNNYFWIVKYIFEKEKYFQKGKIFSERRPTTT